MGDTRFLGKVYKITDKTNGNVYYGSTKQTHLRKRIQGHKDDYKRYLNDPTRDYSTSFDILKNNDYEVSLLEEFICQNRPQLLARERHYIENYPCVNKCIPLRTHKEYYNDNQVAILEYKRKFYILNRDNILMKKSVRYVCPICNKEGAYAHKARHEKSVFHIEACKAI